MKINDLYEILNEEGIYYINHKLVSTRGAIACFKGVTAIVVDDTQIDCEASEITVIIQELGHYFSDSYYRENSSFDLIENMEYKADVIAWLKFFPYKEIKFLRKSGLKSASHIASYFNVEPDYMARCLNFYYKISNGFLDEDLFFYGDDDKYERKTFN